MEAQAPKNEMTPEQREQFGRDWFKYVMGIDAPPPDSPYRKDGIANFVFAEMWSRPGLEMKERRWITLACVAASDTVVPIQAHFYSALKSGDISYEEMLEFVLHFAVYCGWPKASIIDQVVRDAWARIEAEGGVTPFPMPAKPA